MKVKKATALQEHIRLITKYVNPLLLLYALTPSQQKMDLPRTWWA